MEEMDTSSADPQTEAEQPREEEEEEQKMEEEEEEEQKVEEEQEQKVEEEEEQKRKNEREMLPDAPSFAPEDFVFRAPSGVKPFQLVPLTPRSADAFLTPR